MKTIIFILAFIALNLFSCDKEPRVLISPAAGSAPLPVDHNRGEKNGPDPARIKPFGYDLSETHMNYMGIKKPGC